MIRTLERAIELRGKPKLIVMDNGPDFTCRALDEWAWSRGIALHWIDPAKPMQNAFVESFNGRFREECLDQHHFVSLDDARALIESWREDYNSIRPHTSLRGLSIISSLDTASMEDAHPRWLCGWTGSRALRPTVSKVDCIDDPGERVEAHDRKHHPSPTVTSGRAPSEYCIRDGADDRGADA